MKLKISDKFLLSVILMYPVLLAALFFFKVLPFFLTAPYFAFVLMLISLRLFQQKKLSFKGGKSINLTLVFSLVLIALGNFTSVRYSIPIFFTVYLFILYLLLITISDWNFNLNLKLVNGFFVLYLCLSILFLFLEQGYMKIGNRFVGFTGSATTFSGILVALYILLDSKLGSWKVKRISIYILVLIFVYLSKTRLVLLFLIGYPFLYSMVARKLLRKNIVFIIFFGVLFFVYALYGFIVESFPELITLRYKDARDASFGLRYELYKTIVDNFFEGNLWERLLGKGNEYSRILILEERGIDLFPHNDFFRLINDWGIVGALLFFVLVYRLSKKNNTSLFIGLLYLILWYSNMVFNLFICSILILSSFDRKMQITDRD